MMRKLVKKENVKGGEGTVLFDYLLGDEQLQGMCGMYAKVTLPPGSSIGYHTHEGDSESYYILSGQGTYINNNKEKGDKPLFLNEYNNHPPKKSTYKISSILYYFNTLQKFRKKNHGSLKKT